MSYQINRAGKDCITSADIDSLVETLALSQWPADRYEILESRTESLPRGHMDRRWGYATKLPDGTIKIDRDPLS
jgi:hypothetical protein